MQQKNPKRIGPAIVGAGRVGLMRGEIAARFPQVDWIGIAEIDRERGRLVAEKINADFVGSTPAGDMALGALRGPMHEETQSWLMRLAMNIPTAHATAAEGHDRLMLAKAYDLSARLKAPVSLPISPHDEKRVP